MRTLSVSLCFTSYAQIWTLLSEYWTSLSCSGRYRNSRFGVGSSIRVYAWFIFTILTQFLRTIHCSPTSDVVCLTYIFVFLLHGHFWNNYFSLSFKPIYYVIFFSNEILGSGCYSTSCKIEHLSLLMLCYSLGGVKSKPQTICYRQPQ